MSPFKPACEFQTDKRQEKDWSFEFRVILNIKYFEYDGKILFIFNLNTHVQLQQIKTNDQ